MIYHINIDHINTPLLCHTTNPDDYVGKLKVTIRVYERLGDNLKDQMDLTQKIVSSIFNSCYASITSITDELQTMPDVTSKEPAPSSFPVLP